MSTIPLLIEKHPDDYTGLPFLTLIRYNNTEFLAVVDNITEGELRLYHVEECSQYGIDVTTFLKHVLDWHNDHQSIPLSVYLSSSSLTPSYGQIYKSFNVEFISRIIGPIPKYKLRTQSTTRKRKRKSPQENSKYTIKAIQDLG